MVSRWSELEGPRPPSEVEENQRSSQQPAFSLTFFALFSLLMRKNHHPGTFPYKDLLFGRLSTHTAPSARRWRASKSSCWDCTAVKQLCSSGFIMGTQGVLTTRVELILAF